jgi:hypothetical protein
MLFSIGNSHVSCPSLLPTSNYPPGNNALPINHAAKSKTVMHTRHVCSGLSSEIYTERHVSLCTESLNMSKPWYSSSMAG